MSADSQIKSIYERWERLEGEKKAISDDLKELFAESKLAGYDGKALRIAFNRKAKMDAATTADEHFDAVVDTYLDALNGSPRDARLRTRENIEEFDPITGEFLDDEQPETADEMDRATEVSFETGSEAAENARKAVPETEDGSVTHAGAGESPATEFAPASQGEAESPSVESVSPETHGSSDANTGGEDVDLTQNAAHIEAGTLVSENVPANPMHRNMFAHCWPDLTKREYEELEDSISVIGIQDPIVRKGDIILDGWNRYNIARSLDEKYPVIEYDGSDELLDVIRWQRSSRDWTPQQEAKIAKALAAEVPARAEEIFAAFHIVELPDGEVIAA